MKARPASRILYPTRKLKERPFIAILACLGMLIFMTMMVRPPSLSRAQTSESIDTFGSDCSTPKTIFNIGDTVCAVATNPLLASTDPDNPSPPQRKFEWVAPDGSIFRVSPSITTDPQNDTITIPASGASAQLGTWTVKTIDSSKNGHAVARFTVRDPDLPAVDLWTPVFAPFAVSPGSSAPFTVYVTNRGPNDAQNVQVVVTVATNSTFVSESQLTGPAATCTNPSVGGTGSSTCTIPTLPANTTAQFTFVFQVNGDAPGGGEVSSTATVSSDTAELLSSDNTSAATATIPENTTTTCTVSCPSDITVSKEAGQCAATVNFSVSSAGSECGTVSCVPPSGSSFPLGVTNVTCVGESGGPCTFTVTVQDPNPPTISCPSDITVNESSPGFGLAVVNFPAPTLNDGCQAGVSACSPPSGSSFSQGVTNVTCRTSDGSVSCSFSVTVTGVGVVGCTINCPDDLTVPSTGACSAVVTYPAPATSGSCGAVACTPPSGASFPVGTTVVACTASGGPSCDFTVTVLAPAPPVITTCAANKTVAAINCEGVIPNLLGEVVATGCSVVKSQTPAAGTTVGLGTYTVTIKAENSAGERTCTALVTVRDTVPPTITGASATPSSLWPPNHKMRDVTINYQTADNCNEVVTTTLSVTSNEPASPDGDWVIVDAHHVRLRSERLGNGNGRIYTITITATDASGNQTTATTTVTVPHNQ